MRTVEEVVSILYRGKTHDQVYDLFGTALKDLMPFGAVSFLMREGDGPRFQVRNIYRERPTTLNPGDFAPIDHLPMKEVFETKRTHVCPDFDLVRSPIVQDAQKKGFQSSVAAPLIKDGRVFGLLTLVHPVKHTYTEAHAKTLLKVAEGITSRLAGAKLIVL